MSGPCRVRRLWRCGVNTARSGCTPSCGIQVLGKQPARRRQREVEGEARAGGEVLARGDEEHLQISSGGDQRHRVPGGEHGDESLRQPERAQVGTEKLQAALQLRRQAAPRLLRPEEHARARIHAGHRNATPDQRLGETALGDAEHEDRTAGLGQERRVSRHLAPRSVHHRERSPPFSARHVCDRPLGTGVPHRRPARCARGCVRRSPRVRPDLSLRAELRRMVPFPR